MAFKKNSVSGAPSGTTIRVSLDLVDASEPQIVFVTAVAQTTGAGGVGPGGLRVTIETSAGGWPASNSDKNAGSTGSFELRASASDIFLVNAGAAWAVAKVEALGGDFGNAGADLELRVATVSNR